MSENVHVYVVPVGIISDDPEGVKLNNDSEQELRVVLVITGTGLTVTVTLKAVPTQLLMDGVTL